MATVSPARLVTGTQMLIGALAVVGAAGWGFAIQEWQEARQFRKLAKARGAELAQIQAASGLLADIGRRIHENHRRAIEIEIERADLQAKLIAEASASPRCEAPRQ
jgi:hypothetical protein